MGHEGLTHVCPTMLQVEVVEQQDAYSLLVALPGVESSADAVSLLCECYQC